jgi:hypothetical protein
MTRDVIPAAVQERRGVERAFTLDFTQNSERKIR